MRRIRKRRAPFSGTMLGERLKLARAPGRAINVPRPRRSAHAYISCARATSGCVPRVPCGLDRFEFDRLILNSVATGGRPRTIAGHSEVLASRRRASSHGNEDVGWNEGLAISIDPPRENQCAAGRCLEGNIASGRSVLAPPRSAANFFTYRRTL